MNSFAQYVEKDVLDYDPFERLDEAGVGKLMEMSVELGRKARPKLKIGICGEHGGRPLYRKILPQGRPRLRELLAVSRDGRPAGCGPGCDRGKEGEEAGCQKSSEEKVEVRGRGRGKG